MATKPLLMSWSKLPTIVLGAVVVVALIIIAAVFSGASTAERVATNAEDLHWANAMLGSSEIARLSVGEAIVISEAAEAGIVGQAERNVAIADARIALHAAQSWTGRAEADPVSARQAAVVIDAGTSVVDLLDVGDVEAARRFEVDELEPAQRELITALAAAQDDAADAIRETEAAAGHISTLLQLLVILFIPTAALFIYRRRARKELRENRIRMEAELELERDVSGAKDELVAGVSHQFRTPLTSIVGFTEVLLDEPDLDPSHRDMIQVINLETTNLTRMVEDLLMAARLDLSVVQVESGRFEIATELAPIVAEARALGQETEFEPLRATVRSDVGKFRHVVRNLMSNAVTHGGPHARVTVGTDRGRLFVTVADDGDGISPEVEHRIFTPFTNQGSRALLAGSVGMGLAVADALASAIDGSLRYERTPDGWTEFTLWMPVGYSRIDPDVPSAASAALSAAVTEEVR